MGISAKTGVLGRQSPRKTVSAQGISGQIPYVQNREFFRPEQGISGNEQGINAGPFPQEKPDLHHFHFRCSAYTCRTAGKLGRRDGVLVDILLLGVVDAHESLERLDHSLRIADQIPVRILGFEPVGKAR